MTFHEWEAMRPCRRGGGGGDVEIFPGDDPSVFVMALSDGVARIIRLDWDGAQGKYVLAPSSGVLTHIAALNARNRIFPFRNVHAGGNRLFVYSAPFTELWEVTDSGVVYKKYYIPNTNTFCLGNPFRVLNMSLDPTSPFSDRLLVAEWGEVGQSGVPGALPSSGKVSVIKMTPSDEYVVESTFEIGRASSGPDYAEHVQDLLIVDDAEGRTRIFGLWQYAKLNGLPYDYKTSTLLELEPVIDSGVLRLTQKGANDQIEAAATGIVPYVSGSYLYLFITCYGGPTLDANLDFSVLQRVTATTPGTLTGPVECFNGDDYTPPSGPTIPGYNILNLQIAADGTAWFDTGLFNSIAYEFEVYPRRTYKTTVQNLLTAYGHPVTRDLTPVDDTVENRPMPGLALLTPPDGSPQQILRTTGSGLGGPVMRDNLLFHPVNTYSTTGTGSYTVDFGTGVNKVVLSMSGMSQNVRQQTFPIRFANPNADIYDL
jgi:hypothetical protein